MSDVPILLDVDGVINVLPSGDQVDVVEHRITDPRGRDVTLRVRPETPALVQRLAELGPLVWCTAWGDVAADTIATIVGVPTGFPVVPIPAEVHGDGPQGFPVKAPFVRQWAADNGVTRLVWLDDHLGGAADYLTRRPYVSPQIRDAVEREARTGEWHDHWDAIAVHTPPLTDALCIQANPRRGLEDEHVDQIEAWLKALR